MISHRICIWYEFIWFIIAVCPAGTYDYECERNCHPNYYGLQCKEKCNCLKGYMCNSVHGCIRNKTFISTNHTEYRILNSENITVVPHIESRSVFTQVVPVFAMCATLIGWLMMCVQNMKTNLCPKKLNKRCAWHNHHQNKKEKLSTSGSIRQNITKKVAFNTQQHITRTGNNPYCEPWEVTSIV
ncbi:unnamed protein product [Mytilus coruscus]|uniref:MEGF10_11 n=1 Tax=Mytilus coruscus TaxID=42192 RepID=A0A6J8B0W2_MYTCO|nr:unnamed protein product [Mytilus coruscus]